MTDADFCYFVISSALVALILWGVGLLIVEIRKVK